MSNQKWVRLIGGGYTRYLTRSANTAMIMAKALGLIAVERQDKVNPDVYYISADRHTNIIRNAAKEYYVRVSYKDQTPVADNCILNAIKNM